MRRAHRRTHLLLWLVLGPLALALLVTALTSRPDAPVQPAPSTLELDR